MAQNIAINLDALHQAQQRISDERARYNILSCGRRWGKTHFTYRLIAEICQYNLNNGFSEDMGYMSPTYKNLAPTWRRFTKTFAPIITRKSETEHIAEIMNSFVIEFWSLDKPENIRGRQYKRIIVDEAALIPGLRAIFKLILSPTIGDLVGDAWFFSTPRGMNDFHHYYKLGQNPLFTKWASWIMPTSTNPYFPKDELEEQRALLDPDEYAQEWEGKFVSLGNNPFDIDYFIRSETYLGALYGSVPLHRIRYWDIANSEDGDYTASIKTTITTEPRFILSDPVRTKGQWGQTYPFIKLQMLKEPEVLHVFETEGVGSIAWQVINADPDLKHITKLPAGKIFTQSNKGDRANLWAMELRNGRMTIVEDFGYIDVLDEIAQFPHGAHDDWVDSISGAVLAFIYYYGGYQKLLDSKRIKPKTTGKVATYEKQDLIASLADEFS